YTITDGLGNVEDFQPIVLLGADPESRNPHAQLQSMRSAAQYLADRVIVVDSITRSSRHTH
ncbi:MAG TPA: hypothetical protein VHY33_00310, partial [Thermoanaerobaculia bacterium]|nr:hypothetical protein [Thermoanaerobaculia bacterium]